MRRLTKPFLKNIRHIFRERARHAEILAGSPLFDTPYYVAQACAAGLEVGAKGAIYHYIDFGDKMRISPHPLFDVRFYYEQYRDVETSAMTALFHFIVHGHRELRLPHPLFDMKYVAMQMGADDRNPLLAYLAAAPGTFNPHPDIDERFVLDQLVERGRRVKNTLVSFLSEEGHAVNPSWHQSRAECLRRYGSSDKAATNRSGPLKSFDVTTAWADIRPQIELAAAHDVDLVPPETDLATLPTILAIDSAQDAASLLRMLRDTLRSGSVDRIFLLPHFVFGGADKVIANTIKALLETDTTGTILVLATDSGRDDAIGWLPQSDRLHYLNISSFTTGADRLTLMLALSNFLQIARCRHVYVCNSRLGWDIFERFGQSLSKVIALHAFVFCYDYDQFGRRAGYAWTHLPHAIDHLTSVLTDNTITSAQIAQDLRFTEQAKAKFKVLFQPVDRAEIVAFPRGSNATTPSRQRRRRILWAGRFHRQKNIGFAIRVAHELPEADFLFAGGHADDTCVAGHTLTDNMHFLGPYKGIDQLGLDDVDLFLYTSDWDGLPNVVLEIGARGVPIVARDIGGLRDILDETSGWLVPPDETPETTARLIHRVLNADSERAERARRLNERVRARHSWASFTDAVKQHLD